MADVPRVAANPILAGLRAAVRAAAKVRVFRLHRPEGTPAMSAGSTMRFADAGDGPA